MNQTHSDLRPDSYGINNWLGRTVEVIFICRETKRVKFDQGFLLEVNTFGATVKSFTDNSPVVLFRPWHVILSVELVE